VIENVRSILKNIRRLARSISIHISPSLSKCAP